MSNDKMQESCYPNYVRGYAGSVPENHGYGNTIWSKKEDHFMAKYVMALDAGTTSNRCILFNEKGEIIG